MALYLDVTATRIQQYVARWPPLRGRRGASALLSHTMANIADDVGDVATNEEAGRIDGKLSLIVTSGHPERVARRLVALLAQELPAAEFEIRWSEADHYIEAYAAMHDEPVPMMASPPPPNAPLARKCGGCGDAVAVRREKVIDKTPLLCADCSTRNIDRWHYLLPRDDGPATRDKELAIAVGSESFAENFKQLAGLGPSGEKLNHLCTVYADGNSMGSFFAAAIRAGHRLSTLSHEVTEATTAALTDATRAVTDTMEPGKAQTLAVIPHIVGGDDVLATMPAHYGWPFVRIFLKTFETRTAIASTSNGDTAAPTPTCSAGVVFAHEKHPFSQTLEVADDLLRTAKRRHLGQRSSVMWLDLTRSATVPNHRSCPTVQELQSLAPALENVAALPKSTRSGLGRAVESAVDARHERSAITRIADRHGIRATIQPFLAGPLTLSDALDLAHWWR